MGRRSRSCAAGVSGEVARFIAARLLRAPADPPGWPGAAGLTDAVPALPHHQCLENKQLARKGTGREAGWPAPAGDVTFCRATAFGDWERMKAAASVQSETSIEGARAGDPEALASLYRAYGAALYRLAYRLTGTPQDAEDVVHDVFVGLPEALGRYRERGSLAGWLKRVTARVALMRVRTRTRRREVALDATLAAGERPARVESMALETAINGLPDRLRSVVVLKEVEGYSHAEVADLLEISEGASRVRLNRAMKRLRKMLEDGR